MKQTHGIVVNCANPAECCEMNIWWDKESTNVQEEFIQIFMEIKCDIQDCMLNDWTVGRERVQWNMLMYGTSLDMYGKSGQLSVLI